eukprot:gene18992-26898_t
MLVRSATGAPSVEISLEQRGLFVHDGVALGQSLVCLCTTHPPPCPMKRFYVVASIPLLLAALIPIAASLWVAHRQAKEDQVAYLTSLADEVLRRGVASRQQLVAALNDLDGDPHPACSQATLTRMQQLV